MLVSITGKWPRNGKNQTLGTACSFPLPMAKNQMLGPACSFPLPESSQERNVRSSVLVYNLLKVAKNQMLAPSRKKTKKKMLAPVTKKS